MVRLTLALIGLLLLASCNTRQAGGLMVMPVWGPQRVSEAFTMTGDQATVVLDWRTGQAPFTVDIEMPSDFAQQELITTNERHIEVAGIPWLIAGQSGTSAADTYDYTVTFRVRDALGQVLEVESDPLQ